MGLDCTSYFPEKTKIKEVEEFLVLLGYQLFSKNSESGRIIREFSWYEEDNYRSITGVYAHLSLDKETNEIELWTRTTVWRSKFDNDFHNHTIKQLRLRFGGYFRSDYGKNRYFKFSGLVRDKAEAGAYKAYSNFVNNIKRVHVFMMFSDIHNNDKYPIHKDSTLDFINQYNPKITSTNLVVPYLISAIEDYFRSTYVALLKFSDKKEKIIQSSRLQGNEIVDIENGTLTVCEAIAKWMNFQDMEKINKSFKQLNKDIDIYGVLSKPYGRRKETLWMLFERLIEHRHYLIHQATLTIDYYPESLKSDIQSIEFAVSAIYEDITRVYGWEHDTSGVI